MKATMRLVLSLLIAALCGPAQAERVVVFAAASLKTAMEALEPAYEATTGDDLVATFAGSSVLARQISQGAPADLFISANPDWMDWLDQRGAIAPETRFDLTGNRLVLIAHGTDRPPVEIADLPQTRIAMALTEAVPAGIYAKAALQHFDLWESHASGVVQTDNVRSALALVALGEAPFGITYATDALAEPRVTAVYTFPEASHQPIIYPAAAITDGPATQRLLSFLQSDTARAILADQGFTP